MLLSDVVDRLVLRDLHAGAHVTLTMQEEGEGAREVLTAAGVTQREKNNTGGGCHSMYQCMTASRRGR